MRTKLLLLSIMPLAMMVACQSSSPPKPGTGAPGTATNGSNNTYSGWAGTYLTNTCATSQCHVSGRQAPDLSNYNAVRAASSQILSAMQSNMPPSPGKADANSIQQMQAWITAGMPQGGTVGSVGSTTPGYGVPGTGGYVPSVTSTIGTTTDPNALAYNGWVGTYLTSTCATSTCHVAGVQAPDLSSFAAVQAASSQIVTAMQTNMPPTGLADAAATAKIQQWIQSGMPQNAPATGATGTPGVGSYQPSPGGYGPSTGTQIPIVTYAGAIQGLMQQYCLRCHQPGGQGGLDLSTQQAVQFNADRISADVIAGTMPKGGPALPQQVVQQFYNWVNTGAQ